MLISQTPLRHIAMLFVAILTTTLIFTASAAEARSKPVAYTAELQQPVEATRHIIKGTVMHCAGTECKGAKSGSSVKTVCARLSRKVGPLASFTYKGEAVDAETLARCNGDKVGAKQRIANRK
ncbi:CC_3452 family protein [Parasphingorhabdus cellanae]|uniref:Uncharacterized protein n=1 Tax=Parasphingorhabdus cellanae TaxID=2806553 RepID=A0ABX7T070_9SPHN|nr:hypothetical protein [Parasphingorhabdus cellanae]QTD54939.1 hypothetical protein J4G78_11885 [Parasphingorhabdus cellanae]